jgi:hypothetical protein
MPSQFDEQLQRKAGHFEVEDGMISRVTVIDETPITDLIVVGGDASYLANAVAAADDGQAWPSWQFGY